MPSIKDRSIPSNQQYYNTLQPVSSGNSSEIEQKPITANATSTATAPSASATKTTDGYCLSPWGNPSPNRSLLPSQFMYDFDTYRMYPSFFTFRRKWVNSNS